MSRLSELEEVIEEGLATFYSVGYALIEIRDDQHYLEAGFDKFEEYCLERWGLSKYQINTRIDSVLIASTIDSKHKPSKMAHLETLKRVEDEDLRSRIWKEALKRYGEPTNKELSALVNKYENLDPFFLSLVEAGLLLSTQAENLSEKLKSLPKYYLEAFRKFGFTEEKCTQPEIWTKLRQIEWTNEDIVKDAFRTGGIYVDEKTYVSIVDLTLSDLDKLHRIFISENKKLRQDRAKEAQQKKTELIYGSHIYNGLGDFNVIIPQELNLKDIQGVLDIENAKPFAVLVFKNGTGVVNNGQIVDMEKCEIFPQDLLDSIKEHIIC